jgi:DNA-binding LacI/PurR family transcriptional regulator
MSAAGIAPDPEMVIDASFSIRVAERLIGEAVQRGPSFTSIFAANYMMARGAIRALHAHGMRVPADVSVITIDQAEPGCELPYAISRFEQPLQELGRRAGELIASCMGATDPPQACRVLLACHEVAGDTLAPPRA